MSRAIPYLFLATFVASLTGAQADTCVVKCYKSKSSANWVPSDELTSCRFGGDGQQVSSDQCDSEYNKKLSSCGGCGACTKYWQGRFGGVDSGNSTCSGGLSGTIVAAIVIVLVIAVAVAYFIRRRKMMQQGGAYNNTPAFSGAAIQAPAAPVAVVQAQAVPVQPAPVQAVAVAKPMV